MMVLGWMAVWVAAAAIVGASAAAETRPTVDEQDAGVVAVFEVGGTKIELITPTCETSPISKFLAQRGNGIHHICLKVCDIKGCLEDLAGKGVDLVDKTPREGALGHKIAFVSPKSVCNILLELAE
jgi:methylmalonyl-CoA epimerase